MCVCVQGFLFVCGGVFVLLNREAVENCTRITPASLLAYQLHPSPPVVCTYYFIILRILFFQIYYHCVCAAMCVSVLQCVSLAFLFASLLSTGRCTGPPGGSGIGVLRNAAGPVWRGPVGAGGGTTARLVGAKSPQFVRRWWLDTGTSRQFVPRRASEQPQPANLRARQVFGK